MHVTVSASVPTGECHLTVAIAYDAGVLIAADRNDRATWAEHRVLLESGCSPITTAPVAAQATRTSRQVQLRRFLRGCELIGFDPADADPVGQLLGRSSMSDVVDAHLVVVAARRGATVRTSDPDDLTRLASNMDSSPRIDPR